MYDAHSYHTKVPPEAVRDLILEFTRPDATIGDSFCGTGTTGVAAAMADAVDGGRRSVVLGDLSPYATFIAQHLNCPPPVSAFEQAAGSMIGSVDAMRAALWATVDPTSGLRAEVAYVIWSEVIRCPRCSAEHRFWDLGVDQKAGTIRRLLRCPCGEQFGKRDAERVIETKLDPLLGKPISLPKRVPVRMVCVGDGGRFEKDPDAGDYERLQEIEKIGAPVACPNVPIRHWGDLYRSGYHSGITHVHHFYTWRNFLSIGTLWEAAASSELAGSLRFLVSSYNVAHSTLMSRIVFKANSARPVLTGYQTGALYISALPVEKNPFMGVSAKIRALAKAFEQTVGRRGDVTVVTRPAQSWTDVRAKLDYVFVDPPFGANIPYSEANFIGESWLGQYADASKEATISRSRGRSSQDYEVALYESFSALRSRLTSAGRMTVMFHSTESESWKALLGALRRSGFESESVLTLSKVQSSFKQVRSTVAVEGDALINVRVASRTFMPKGVGKLSADEWLARLTGSTLLTVASVRAARALYSEYVAECARRGVGEPTSARIFYSILRRLREGSMPDGQAALTG